jgi:hypothetical protein
MDEGNEKLARFFLDLELSKVEKVTDGLTRCARGEVANELDRIAVHASRLSAYLNERGGNGCGDSGHAEGVKAQNKKAAKVRKALGYSYPDQCKIEF